ncbi:MAG: hypothetical protein J7647_16540 [Cyanobacteria bacterium SBLK]|nr:hypothetical protein [Cyanobacteria bacterium SBLK]
MWTIWALLRRVRQTKKISDSLEYPALIRSRFVFEYCDSEGLSWFDVNPVLTDAEELRHESDGNHHELA